MACKSMPGAWYDAISRVEAALAVSRMVREVVPFELGDCDMAKHAFNLAVAVEELLTLAKQDMDQIETEWSLS